jgi:hypothetical protein
MYIYICRSRHSKLLLTKVNKEVIISEVHHSVEPIALFTAADNFTDHAGYATQLFTAYHYGPVYT